MVDLYQIRAQLLPDASTNASRLEFVVKRALSSELDVTKLYNPTQIKAIQLVTCICAGLSFTTAVITGYWFYKMKRRFRHTLIFLLVTADVSRSVWLFMFGIVSLSRGHVNTSSNFCQASGFFFQTGLEQADHAVLAIAVHTALQVFRPSINTIGNRVEENGLYRYRHGVYVIFAVVPPFMASLAFIQGRQGYRSQGPFCNLPLRPFWYRLAISWIPRYVIILTVAGLYLAIYIHVAIQFQSINWLRRLHGSSRQGGSSLTMPNTYCDGAEDGLFNRRYSVRHPSSQLSSRRDRASVEQTPPHFATLRKLSSAFTSVEPSTVNTPTKGSALDVQLPNRDDTRTESGVDGCVDFVTSHLRSEPALRQGAAGGSSEGLAGSPSPARLLNRGVMREEMKERHQAVQRQIRSLFVYPVCYFLVWLFPFIDHSLNYNNYYAQHPRLPIVFITYIALASMGLIDCLIFTTREKPWRHIRGSDGTFSGSFLFWKHTKRRRGSSASTYSLPGRDTSVAEPTAPLSTRLGQLGSIAEANDSVVVMGREQRSRRSHDAPQLSLSQAMEIPPEHNMHDRHGRPAQETDWFDRRLSLAIGRRE